MKGKNVRFQEYRWAWEATKLYHGRCYLLCALAVGTVATNLGMAVLLRNIINAAANHNEVLVGRWAGAMCALGFVEVALVVVSRVIRDRTSNRIVQHLQQRLFSVLLAKDYTHVSDRHSAEWMNRMVSDVGGIASALVTMIPGMISALLSVAGSGYLIYKNAPLLLFIVLLGGVLLVVLNYLMRNPLKRRERRLRELVGVKNVYVTEHLSKLLIVKSFNREALIERDARGKFDAMTNAKTAKSDVTAVKDGIQTFAMRVAYLVMIVYCAYGILGGRITYGSAVMLMRLMSQVSSPLTDISSYLTQAFDVAVSAERLQEAESYPDDPDGPVRDDEEVQRFYDEEFVDFTLDDAAFSYKGAEGDSRSAPTVFEHVNLRIPKKSCVAITGVTGSGKSTLFKILMSFYGLSAGRTLVHTNDGREFELDASLRRMFAYVPQGNQLMAGTIRDMVTFGEARGDDTDERVWRALDEACAREFVEALPHGLDTTVKERGAGLSEGQLQRIAVARSLYTNRPVLLLDEATSALDEATERALLSHLREMTNRTILFVTHRPNALTICDLEIHIDGTDVSIRELG